MLTRSEVVFEPATAALQRSTIADRAAAGLVCYQAGDPAAAAAHFASVLEQAPHNADVLRLCGLALVRAGRGKEALPLLARAVARTPQSALAHLHHGIGLLEVGRPARAAARFRRAALLAPAMPATWINLSAALLALGHPKAARAAARRALHLAPTDPDALHALGRGHVGAADNKAAVAIFKVLLEHAPQRAEAWIDLGLVHARTGEIYAARQAMRRALALQPEHSIASANLAGLNLVGGHALLSIRTLHDVISRDPSCVTGRLNLANVLLLEREPEEALAVLAGPPPAGREGVHWQAHRALALLLLDRVLEATQTLDAILPPYHDAEILIVTRRLHLSQFSNDVTIGESFAARLEVLFAEEGVSLFEHRVLAAFELGWWRSARGERAEAFRLWKLGHQLMARAQPFSRVSFTSFVDTSIAAYTPTRFPRSSSDEDTTPVFIVGLPRSGTTLCEQVLSAHAEVHGAGERGAVYDLLETLGGAAHQAKNIQELAGLEPEILSKAASAFLDALHAEEPSARYVIDKMPANALHVGFLASLLPGARFIHCTRDPRDIGLSIFQRRFFGYHPYAHDLADLGFYIAEHDRLMAHWRQVVPNPMIEVSLHDWVADFSGTVGRLETFLDLPHDPACDHFYQSTRRVRTASAAQVREPINARGLGRWHAYAQELAPMIAEMERIGPASRPPRDDHGA